MSKERVCHSSDERPTASTMAVICGSSSSAWSIWIGMVRISSMEVWASVSICARCSGVRGWVKFKMSIIPSPIVLLVVQQLCVFVDDPVQVAQCELFFECLIYLLYQFFCITQRKRSCAVSIL